jgi:tetratricopeptide (TPR) repeat protein
MNRQERRAAGRKSQAGEPGSAAALYEAGLRHLRTGQYLDAQMCCQQALATDSNHADSLNLMAMLSLQAKQYDHAVEWAARALQQAPKPEYLVTLGSALQNLGRLEEALKAFDKAVQFKPEIAELWKNLGNVLLALERPAEALLSFQHILTLNPRHWESAYQSAVLLHEAARLEEAVKHFDLCIRLKPDHALTLRARARSLRDMNRLEQALQDSQRACALEPGDAGACNGLGDILARLPDRQEEALQWFDRALELQPDFIQALTNKALVLGQLLRCEEAIASYDRLKSLDPDNAEADISLGHLHLLLGNFESGWTGHEARRRIPSFSAPYPKFSQPAWLGEDEIEGKTILVHVDEGFGDTIQFARYLPMLAARGARVLLVVDGPAYALLRDLAGVSQCFAFPAHTLPPFDFHCPMSSLPLAFATRLDTIPSGISYLPAPAASRVQAWESRLAARHRLRVGLVWSGNPNHRNDQNRSIPLRTLSRILDADADFVSLQKDPRADDKELLLEFTGIIDPTADLTDFAETAALLRCLDLVITVDTSVAHLAGAMGCPTWILLPYTPDWRWLLDREDSPWYPTVRLFRQPKPRDYDSVIDRVGAELMAMISERGSAKATPPLGEAATRSAPARSKPPATP